MSQQGCQVSYRVIEKLLNGGANKNAFMSESRDIRKIFRRYARLPAEDRGTRTVESRVGLGVRWEMAVGGGHTPSRKRSSEFSMESANDKIRARPFRHTKFQDVSARLRTLSIRGASAIRPLPRRARGRDDVENVVRGIYQSSSSTRYLIFMKDSGRRTRSRRKTLGRKMTAPFIERNAKRLNPGRKGFDDGRKRV